MARLYQGKTLLAGAGVAVPEGGPVTSAAGFMLLLKKRVDWIQPPTLRRRKRRRVARPSAQ